MKSEHRHELETNALAKWVGDFINRFREYGSTALMCIAALVLAVFAYVYFSGSNSSRQGEAWNEFNNAMITAVSSRSSVQQSLADLKLSAEAYPDTATQEWADVTWADGQVLLSSWDYIHNRPAAMEAVNKAMSTYQGLLQETDNPALVSRAHFGLGRVYELKDDLDKARSEYGSVNGPLAEVAKHRAEQLGQPAAKESYEWLASAEAPRARILGNSGLGPMRPNFSEDSLDLPPAKEGGEKVSPTAVEDLFKGIGKVDEGTERYGDEKPAGTDSKEEGKPATDAKK